MPRSPTSTRAKYSAGPLAGASIALMLAKEARADMPNDQQILGVAMSIAELAEKVEKNESMRALAQQAVTLARKVVAIASMRPEDLVFLRALEPLKGTLTKVEQLMAAEAKERNRAMVIYRSLFVLPAKTVELSLRLESEYHKFVPVMIDTRAENASDGPLRKLRDYEVRKLDVIREYETHHATITFAKARVDGVSNLLIVKYIRVKDGLSPNNNRSPQQLIYLVDVFTPQKNLMDIFNAATLDMDYDDHPSLYYESNSQEYDLGTQIEYYPAAERPSSSNHENARGVYLSFRHGTTSSAPGTIFSFQGYAHQNVSVETFFTALTIVTVATSYHTAEDSADVYITNFADLLRIFRDLDITDQIESVSPLVIGIGGTASVRQASYRDQPVAIKVAQAPHAANEKTVKRLAREIAVWRTLSHKNVLPLYGLYYYAEERVPAMVSPWCANGNLVDYLAARSHLPAVDMAQLQLRLLLDTLEGLACLHHERVVHGDLKGPNILVLDDGTACVADFGVSAVLCDHPRSASAAGTFRWMAPELVSDDNPLRTREGDMWAFGCVMVEAISGKRPFDEIKNELGVIIALFKGKTPSRPPQASEMMWECCQECFRQKPEDRLTADILLLRLRALVEGTHEGFAVALPPQEPQREQAPATSTSYEGYSV